LLAVQASRQEFSAAAHVEMSVECGDVNVDGVSTDTQIESDLFFAVAGQEAFERLAMAGRKAGKGSTRRARVIGPEQLAKFGHHPPLARYFL